VSTDADLLDEWRADREWYAARPWIDAALARGRADQRRVGR